MKDRQHLKQSNVPTKKNIQLLLVSGLEPVGLEGRLEPSLEHDPC